MSDDHIEHVKRIARYRWRDVSGHDADFLTQDEVKNLTIRAGTLTDDERKIINHHIVATIKMLEALPWPKHLTNVPEYAGGHHERMDGKGYPRGLKREDMSIQARCMGIADIFEALTAEGQDALRIARDPRADEAQQPRRSRPVRRVRAAEGLPTLRRDVPRPGADRQRRRIAHPRVPALACATSFSFPRCWRSSPRPASPA
jgi:hypothetical protein